MTFSSREPTMHAISLRNNCGSQHSIRLFMDLNLAEETLFSSANYRKQRIFATEKIDYEDDNYLFKVNNRNTRRTCEICSKLIILQPQSCSTPIKVLGYFRQPATTIIP